MKKLTTRLLALALSLLVASAAFAQVDVELAFDPAEAYPGDTVSFFAAITNLGDEAADMDLGMTFAWEEWEFGPFPGVLPLAAGEELSTEFDFMIPPFPFGGTLTITIVATAGEYSDTAIASLTILSDGIVSEEQAETSMREFLEFYDGLADEITATGVSTTSALKALY